MKVYRHFTLTVREEPSLDVLFKCRYFEGASKTSNSTGLLVALSGYKKL